MKTNVIFILVLGILICSCSFGQQVKNDLEELNLKGKVKSFKEFQYEAEDKFGEVIKGEKCFSCGKDILYNVQGNKIEEYFFDSYGMLLFKYLYEYDKEGNLIEKNIYTIDGNLWNKFIYRNNENGNPIQIIRFVASANIYEKDTCIYEYDDKKNILKKFANRPKYEILDWADSKNVKEYEGDIKLKAYYYSQYYNCDEINLYKYDENENMTENYYYDWHVGYRKTTYKHDDQGNKIEENYYECDSTEILKSKHTFRFDEGGNIIEEVIEYQQENRNASSFFTYNYEREKQKFIYAYELDQKKNWIRKVKFDENKIPLEIVERELKYYK